MYEAEVYLTRIEPERNCHRFYKMAIWPTLFREYALVREWGRIGHGGTVRITTCEDGETLRKEIAETVQRKTQRGYQRKIAVQRSIVSGMMPTIPLP